MVALVLLGISLIVVSCTTGPDSKATPGEPSPGHAPTSEPAASTPDVSPTSPIGGLSPTAGASAASGTAIPSGASAAVDLARQALATKSGVPVGQIQVISVTSVQWPNSALGCPEPGRMYSQVVTPGYRIILAANGQSYEYHSDSGRRVVSCTGH